MGFRLNQTGGGLTIGAVTEGGIGNLAGLTQGDQILSVGQTRISSAGDLVSQLEAAADATGNACPSLHAAFCVFTGLALHAQLGSIGAPRAVRGANALWCLGILYSTIATGQHVVLDALAGAALGAAAAMPYVRMLGARRPAG